MQHTVFNPQAPARRRGILSRVLETISRFNPFTTPAKAQEFVAEVYEEWALRAECDGDDAAAKYWADRGRAIRKAICKFQSK